MGTFCHEFRKAESQAFGARTRDSSPEWPLRVLLKMHGQRSSNEKKIHCFCDSGVAFVMPDVWMPDNEHLPKNTSFIEMTMHGSKKRCTYVSLLSDMSFLLVSCEYIWLFLVWAFDVSCQCNFMRLEICSFSINTQWIM